MIKKILNNLKKPHRIPAKLLSKIEYIINKKKYDKSIYENKQNQIFKKLNLDRDLGKKKLDAIKKKYKDLSNRGMASEHEVLFSSFSCNPKFNINEILEIGTFDGANAFLLSLLYNAISLSLSLMVLHRSAFSASNSFTSLIVTANTWHCFSPFVSDSSIASTRSLTNLSTLWVLSSIALF